MDAKIHVSRLGGTATVPPSKSAAHRAVLCAALADGTSHITNIEYSKDIRATLGAAAQLGAKITEEPHSLTIKGHGTAGGFVTVTRPVFCNESGSTLRFLLPVAGALGVDAMFHLEGRLPSRPLSPLWDEMERMGCTLTRPTVDTVRCTGRLRAGEYVIDGGVSSQFITGLLLSAALIPGKSRIRLTGKVESRPYITMTQRAMEVFGKETSDFVVTGGTPFHSPGTLTVEGDWSNAAFFLAAKALGSSVEVTNLSPDSPQGDRAVFDLLPALENSPVISAADIPDLVPILAVTAACKNGAVFTDIRRLRLKESDRVASVIAMVEALGGKAQASEDTLTVYGTGLVGGTVDAMNDHRIAMSAAIAATACTQPVTILDAQCVEKSYPKFFEEYARLGGNYEQYLR